MHIAVIIFILALFGAGIASAEELPTLSLSEGTSTVALSVLNNGETDLSRVTLAVNRENLPAWLSVLETPKAVDAPKGMKAPEKLSLTFHVANAPLNTEAQIPFTLKDDKGNAWSYTLKVKVSSSLPIKTELYENSPNPFNPTTAIRFALKDTGPVNLAVFNSLGQKVRVLADGPRSAGVHAVMWDGRDDSGRAVSSGVYFCRMQAGKYSKTQKMLYAR
jgi:hypothetical protein